VARVIHRAGPRGDGPLVDVNCAAIPRDLLEAELFGFERGAFTDARQPKAGLFQSAHGGTILLDEIALLSDALQAKLLNVIEERRVRRLGSTRSEPVDISIIAATNEDLVAAVRARRFREDLYHRLAVVTLRLPSLRDRRDDIPTLAEHFLTLACQDYGLTSKRLTSRARAALCAHGWPGNVRELANVMERAVLLAETSHIDSDTLELLTEPAPSQGAPGAAAPVPALDAQVESLEREPGAPRARGDTMERRSRCCPPRHHARDDSTSDAQVRPRRSFPPCAPASVSCSFGASTSRTSCRVAASHAAMGAPTGRAADGDSGPEQCRRHAGPARQELRPCSTEG
jgi:DNA-binding NtrC family response regulator